MSTDRTRKATGRLRPADPIIERQYANDLTDVDQQRLIALLGQIISVPTRPTGHDGADGTRATPIRIHMTVEHTTRKKGKKRTESVSRTFIAPTAPGGLDFMARHLHAMQHARPTILAMAGEAFDRAHADGRDTTTGTDIPASRRPVVDRRAQDAGRHSSTPPSSHGRDTDREASR